MIQHEIQTQSREQVSNVFVFTLNGSTTYTLMTSPRKNDILAARRGDASNGEVDHRDGL